MLLSGDHGAIARWRRDEALRRTAAVRPDLVTRLLARGRGRSRCPGPGGTLGGWFSGQPGGCGTLKSATHVGQPRGCASWCPRSPGYPEYTDRRHAFAGLCARADN